MAGAVPAKEMDESDSSGENDTGSYDDVENSAADELASLAGVKDKAAFKSALSDYVRACVKRAMDEEE